MAFTDIMGQYMDRRLGDIQDRYNQVGGLLSGDQDAWASQFGLETEEEKKKRREREQAAQQAADAANTVVHTTKVDTYGDGSQTETIKREIAAPAAETPAPQYQAPEQPAVQAPMMPPTAAPAQPQLSMAEQEQQRIMAERGVPAGPAAPVAPEQPAPAPAPAPQAATPAPMAPVAPTPQPQAAAAPAAPAVPQMPAMPQPGPGVQVAGPMVIPPAPTPTPAAAVTPVEVAAPAAEMAAAPEPTWMKEANAAGNDFEKLMDIASRYPESRGALKEKLKTSLDNQRKESEAQKIVMDAAQGDLKAQNKLQQALRPEKGRAKEEVTVNDYIKLYLYNRLGLGNTQLARQLDAKISGTETKFGQVSLGGANWQIETDNQGNIVAAKDDEGNVATESTLNKLRAGSMKLGTHAFGFTGTSATIPAGQADAGQEYRQRTNAITGAIENVITTGPNAGKIYSGPPGLEKRVETSAAVALNDAAIKFQTAPTIAAATRMMELAGQVDPGNGRVINETLARIQSISPQIFNQVRNMVPQAPAGAPAVPAAAAQPAAPGAAPTVVPGAAPAAPAAAPARAAGAPGVGVGGGGSLLQQKEQQEANIQIGKELAVAKGKPSAEARGKLEAKDINNQAFADSTYELIRPIANLVKKSTGSGIGAKVDSIAAVLGASTEGAQAIAELEPMVYPILANVPRFEGPQSDYDVKTYQKAAGDFANPEKPIKTRLAALQGIVALLKKYDKAGKNDWTFGETQAPASSGTTTSGNKYKRVQ